MWLRFCGPWCRRQQSLRRKNCNLGCCTLNLHHGRFTLIANQAHMSTLLADRGGLRWGATAINTDILSVTGWQYLYLAVDGNTRPNVSFCHVNRYFLAKHLQSTMKQSLHNDNHYHYLCAQYGVVHKWRHAPRGRGFTLVWRCVTTPMPSSNNTHTVQSESLVWKSVRLNVRKMCQKINSISTSSSNVKYTVSGKKRPPPPPLKKML